MRLPEACILQVNDTQICHPKEAQNHSHSLDCSLLVEWPAYLNS